jgi:hypothetical protein
MGRVDYSKVRRVSELRSERNTHMPPQAHTTCTYSRRAHSRRIEKQRVTIAEFCECGKQNQTTKRRVCQVRLALLETLRILYLLIWFGKWGGDIWILDWSLLYVYCLRNDGTLDATVG